MSSPLRALEDEPAVVAEAAAEAELMSTSFPSLWRRCASNPRVMIGAVILLLLVIIAVFAPLLAPFDPKQQDLIARLKPPGFTDADGAVHLLGTDQFGRDVLSRLIYGTRTPLTIGFSAAILGSLIGLLLGLPAGYYRGKFDSVISWFIDLQLSVPFILVALVVVSLFGPTQLNIILVFALTSWSTTARVTRASAISVTAAPYVEAARSIGASNSRIITRELLPNALAATIVVASVQVAQFIILESAMGFLGLGVPPPAATWGNMLADARSYLQTAWWLGVFPGTAIAIAALAANLLGDGLRDTLDPRGSRRI